MTMSPFPECPAAFADILSNTQEAMKLSSKMRTNTWAHQRVKVGRCW